MNPIKVITQKIPTMKFANCTYNYFTDQLTQLASTFPGFIHSESYWNCVNTSINNSHYTISDWKTLRDWDRWQFSEERTLFFKNSTIHFECSHLILNKQNNIKNFPLL